MKKIFIPLFALFMVLINIRSIKAENINDEIYIDYSFSYPVATTKFNDHSKYIYDYEHPIRRKSDNKILYCLEAHNKVNDNSLVTGYNYDDDINILIGLTQNEKERIKKIAYYGYEYQNHNSMDYYVATQIMIWRITNKNDNPPYPVEDGDTSLNYSDKYDDIINEITNLVENHKNTLDLTQTNIHTMVETYPIISDKNGILSKYDAIYEEPLNVTITNNNLIINSSKKYEGLIKLKPHNNEKTIIYEGANQKLIRVGDLKLEETDIKVKIISGYVRGNKYNDELNISQGDATLEGAIYNIYDLENNFVTSVTTDSLGNFKSEELDVGKYYIKETKAPIGYLLDREKHYFEIGKNNMWPILSLKENIIKNNISILKQYKSDTDFLNAESDISFEIYYKNSLYTTITTDKNGYANVILPYGTYRIHQMNTLPGYSKINDFYVTVDDTSDENQYYNILNNKLSAYLKVVKIDEETNNIIELENVSFKLLNLDTNKYVSQYVGNDIISTFKTNDKGVMITPLKLDAGHYRLIEIEAPKGYLLGEPIDFEIGDNTNYSYTTYGPFLTLYYKNRPIKGLIEIYKKGEIFKTDELQILENVKFNIYAYDDIKSSDNSFNYYTKDELVDTLITNEFGYAKSMLLPLGKYKVVEVETNEKYHLDNNEYVIEIDEIDKQTEIIYKELNLVNRLKTNLLEFTKLDEDTLLPLENVEIEIYDEFDNLIMTNYTNEEGKINIELPIGFYYLKEKNTIEGYIKNEKIVNFEITENEPSTIKMTNKKINNNKKIKKEDNIKSTNITEKMSTQSNIKIDNIPIIENNLKETEQSNIIDNILKIDIPNTELKQSVFLKIFGILLMISGVIMGLHDRKKK